VAELCRIEDAELTGAEPGTRLEVMLEPTGPAWLPVAVFFCGRGHVVFRVPSAEASDLRPFLSRNAKSNGIDADTLGRWPHRGIRRVDQDRVEAVLVARADSADSGGDRLN